MTASLRIRGSLALLLCLAVASTVGAQAPAEGALESEAEAESEAESESESESESEAEAESEAESAAEAESESSPEEDPELSDEDPELSDEDLELSDEDLELSDEDLELSEDELAGPTDEEPAGVEHSGSDEAGSAEEDVADEDLQLRELTVAYTPEDIFRLGGSATILDEATLDTFEYDDPHALLLQVPGVYVRGEDGVGLRPNIGLRGTNPNRSAKITLLEDGILFGPAPYAAPAAYFFPLMARMVGVEVFKGPAALLYGPQTIGGAINFRSREVPTEPRGEIDVALGRFLQRRLHGWWGTQNRLGGFVFEALDTGSEGFKRIDGSTRSTGYGRTELMARGFLQTAPTGRIYNRVELELGFSRERSNETYLGLSDEDFSMDPDRRYAASERDLLEWWRTSAELQWRLDVGDHVQVVTSLYRHDMTRGWFRANRFRDGPSLHEATTNPSGRNRAWYEVISGFRDSETDEEAVLLVDNDRRYVSQGLQSRARLDVRTGPVNHEVELGVRVHQDEVNRDQREYAHAMRGGTLVPLDEDPSQITDNTGSAFAVAGYAVYGLSFFDVTLTPGVRFEYIATSLEDRLAGETSDADQVVVLPGVGIQYTFLERFGVLAGVHRGFSPVGPGNGDTAEPELSVNYELGGRFRDPDAEADVEIIGFLNDYSNFLFTCTGSSGCAAEDVGRQFNAGSAWVWGVEASARWRPEVGRFHLPMQLSYTYTGTRFRESFTSGSPGYENVQEGDPIPYVPEHQGHLQFGLESDIAGGNVALNVVPPLRESSDASAAETDLQVLVDAVVWGQLTERLRLYVKGQNLANQRVITARRPFGARPTPPLSVIVGARLSL